MEPEKAVLSKEAENGARLSVLLIDVGTEVLRNTLIQQLQREFGTLSKVLARNRHTLQQHRHCISIPRWSLIFPVIGYPDSKTFDKDIFDFLDAHLLNNALTLTKPLADLRSEFDDAIKELGTLEHVLSDHEPELKKYLTGAGKPKLLRPEQWDLLFPQVMGPPPSRRPATNPIHFDLTLLCFLLRNLCNLPNPSNNWNMAPNASDKSLSADIVRLRLIRNNMYGHISSTALDSQTFKQEWKDLKTILCRLGVTSNEIDQLKRAPLSEDQESKYKEELRRVTESDLTDIQILMKKIDERSQAQIEQVSEIKSDIKQLIQKTELHSSCSVQRDELDQKTRKRKRIASDESEEDPMREFKDRFLETVKQKYLDHYKYIPLKPWVEGDFIHIEKIFVNLELIQREEFRKSKECKRYKHYYDMFQESGKKFVIAGAAGMGKSTLAHKMCYDWATLEGGICKYECVFLIKARDIKTDIVTQIIQVYMPLEQNNPVLKECITGLLNKETTLIIMDGLDEGSSKKNVNDVISGQLYPSVHVVVTTRPHSLVLLQSIPEFSVNQFNITGFTQDDVVKYVCQYFCLCTQSLNMESYWRWRRYNDSHNGEYYSVSDDNGDDIDGDSDDGEYYSDSNDGDCVYGPGDVIDVTESVYYPESELKIFQFISAIDDNDLWHLVRSPILCLFLTYLWEQLESLPETKTEIYKTLINLFEKIYVQKHTSGYNWKDCVNKVGKLALNMLLNEKEGTLIFDKNTVEQYLDAEVACKMGLISAVESVSASQKTAVDLLESSCQSWYSFRHKSIQEYCAAVFLQSKISQGKSDSDEVIAKIKSVIQTSDDVGLWDVFLSFIHDLDLKTKNKDTAGYKLMLHVNDVISNDTKLISSHSLLQAICSRQLDWWEHCGADVDYINVIYTWEDTNMYKEYIKYLKSVNKNVTDIKAVSSTKLRYIRMGEDVERAEDSDDDIIKLDDVTELLHIVHISKYLIHFCIYAIDLSRATDLGTVLPDTLQGLTLKECELSSTGVWTVLDNINRLTKLTHLHFSWNKCKNDITALPSTTTTTPTNTLALEEVYMSDFPIPKAIIFKVIALMRQSPGLLKLNLINTSIGKNVSYIAGALLPTLQELILTNCDLTPSCITHITNILSRLSNLRKLELGGNDLSDCGAELCDNITSTIETLWLMKCNLTPSSISAVINNLPKWDRLCLLDLAFNPNVDTTVWFEMLSVLPKCTQQGLTVNIGDCNICTNLIQKMNTCNENITVIDTWF